MMTRHILIMAGGTGGHVFPGLACAREFQRRGMTVSWLGTSAGIEAKLVPQAGIELFCIDIKGVRGKGVARLLFAPLMLMQAVWQAIAVVRKVKPDCVLGMGGFAAAPGGFAARILCKPLVIHEQNSVAGTTNRLLAPIAKRVMEAFPDTFARTPKVRWAGNPVREEITAVAAVAAEHKPLHLLVLGGSLGAQVLNETVPAALAIIASGERPLVRHQCGVQHAEKTMTAYRQHNVDAEVQPFIADMAAAYQWADVVVCRAGALTIAELTCAGRASILVPLPHAIDDHQTKNAQWLAQTGGAQILLQKQLTAESLAQHLLQFIRSPQQIITMANAARAQSKPDATSIVADACQEVMDA
jgi:UDP-N-acetylglucosamine--N-acetylmuramyl-(pentapeptide) pyrophosphoryl-undecaprenol N-acetylglucosamine transferase